MLQLTLRKRRNLSGRNISVIFKILKEYLDFSFSINHKLIYVISCWTAQVFLMRQRVS